MPWLSWLKIRYADGYDCVAIPKEELIVQVEACITVVRQGEKEDNYSFTCMTAYLEA